MTRKPALICVIDLSLPHFVLACGSDFRLFTRTPPSLARQAFMNSLSRGDVDGDKTALAIADGLLVNLYDPVAGAASAVDRSEEFIHR